MQFVFCKSDGKLRGTGYYYVCDTEELINSDFYPELSKYIKQTQERVSRNERLYRQAELSGGIAGFIYAVFLGISFYTSFIPYAHILNPILLTLGLIGLTYFVQFLEQTRTGVLNAKAKIAKFTPLRVFLTDILNH